MGKGNDGGVGAKAKAEASRHNAKAAAARRKDNKPTTRKTR